MTGLSARIRALVQLSLQDPRAATRALLAEDVPLAARSGGAILMAVLSALMLQASFALMPPGEDPMAVFLARSPFQTALVQWLLLLLSATLIYRVGRAFNGRGTLPDALLIVVWLQLVMLGVQFLQLLALIFAPPLAGLIGLGGFGLFLWLLVNFIAELHGFPSRGLVLVGVLLTFLAVAFVAAILLSLFLGPEAFANV